MDGTQSNRSDNLGDISELGLIPLKAKLVPAAIRHDTVPAHTRDHAVQRPKMITTPNLATVPPLRAQITEIAINFFRAQRSFHAPWPRLPINILTGFLGSGKTTVLRHILHDPAFANTAVLINEFGTVGLDHLLVGALDEVPVLLESGCVCCSIRGDFSRAVRDLHARRQRGELPPFERVIVETTGLADPTPILATITSDLVIRRHFRPGTVVATLDGLHAERGLDEHEEVAQQAAIADRLIITKADLAGGGQVARLRGRQSRLNPAAPVIEAVLGAVDAEFLIGQDISSAESKVAEARVWMQRAGMPWQHGHLGGHRPGGAITSFCLHQTGKLDSSVFGLWFSMLTYRHGSRLLRVRGILDVDGGETPVAIHAVQHVIHPPEHLPDWPDAARGSRIVFITQELDRELVERSLAAFHGLAKPTAASDATPYPARIPQPHGQGLKLAPDLLGSTAG